MGAVLPLGLTPLSCTRKTSHGPETTAQNRWSDRAESWDHGAAAPAQAMHTEFERIAAQVGP
jgi:hypothetical protein